MAKPHLTYRVQFVKVAQDLETILNDPIWYGWTLHSVLEWRFEDGYKCLCIWYQ